MSKIDSRDALEVASQEILVGSAKIHRKEEVKFDPTLYSIQNMSYNKAFTNFVDQNPDENFDQILDLFRSKYREYRYEWQARSQLRKKNDFDNSMKPLCLDIETAAICDLACSFCFRDMFFTPDKIIDTSFAKGLIIQAAKMEIPSIKLNWRGEPLLYPKIAELISFAKEMGILEVMINTNATKLTEEKSKELIEAGLDVIIFSFDGGTSSTYEKMRPGRFNENSFNIVYSNIKTFSKVRESMNSPFPRSKIQMVLTNDTWAEQSNFFNLFNDIVDEVTVTQYNERGGSIEDLDEYDRSILETFLNEEKLSSNTPYMKTADGKLFISRERSICAQPFQRMLVTYDGRVGMCCHDWGAQHAVGYASEEAYTSGKDAIASVEIRTQKNQKGFETFKKAKRPQDYNEIDCKVSDLSEIWGGKSIETVREHQIKGLADNIKICEKCSYKDAYSWELIHDPSKKS